MITLYFFDYDYDYNNISSDYSHDYGWLKLS